MQTTSWLIATLAVVAIVVVAIAVGVLAARRHSRTYVPATPATISVTEPVEDVLESPRHAAEARTAEARIGGTVVGRNSPGA